MRTKTTTGVTHYHIQKKRRAEFIEEWRKHRRTVVRRDEVALQPTARGMRSGVYMGWDGDSPTRCLDALVHELDAGGVTTVHRHSWDAQLFIVEGSGWSEIDGTRYAWKPWDAIHLPAWSWHRHGNDGKKMARFMSYSSEPMLWTLGMSLLEDRGRLSATAPKAMTLMRAASGASPRKRESAAAAGFTRRTTSRSSWPRHAARGPSSWSTAPSAARPPASRR